MRWCIARERKDAPVFQRDGHKFPLTDLVRSTFIIIYTFHTHSYTILVGGLEHVLFFHILGMSSSQVTVIFFRGVGQQPTTICWVKSVKSTTSPCDISPEAVRGQAWSHQSVQLGRQVPSAGKADLHQTAQGGRWRQALRFSDDFCMWKSYETIWNTWVCLKLELYRYTRLYPFTIIIPFNDFNGHFIGENVHNPLDSGLEPGSLQKSGWPKADLMPTGLQSGANLATINEERRIRQGQTAVRSKDAEACHASAETEHVEASPEHGDAPLDAMYPEEEGPLGKENYVQSAEAESGQAKASHFVNFGRAPASKSATQPHSPCISHDVLKDDTEDVTAKSRKALALDVSRCEVEFVSATDIKRITRMWMSPLKVREAECFFMWDSDDDTCGLLSMLWCST